jgi:hypothetical protein
MTSEYGLVRYTTRSSVMVLGRDKRTIFFNVIASYALSGRSLNGVILGVKTPGRVLKPLRGKSDTHPES